MKLIEIILVITAIPIMLVGGVILRVAWFIAPSLRERFVEKLRIK